MNYTSKEVFLIKSSSYLSILVSLMILMTKIYGWLSTNSMTILASLIDSLLDCSMSVVNIIALYWSLIPPDDNHRFGHQKVEDLALFGQALFFILSGLFTLFLILSKSSEVYEIEQHLLGVRVMLLSLALNAFLVCYQTFVSNKTQSGIVQADRIHYVSDFLTNIAGLVTLSFSNQFKSIDLWCASLIAIYIIFSSYKLLRKSISSLLDQELENEQKREIIAIISQSEHVRGIHELKTRIAGKKIFIQFHIELDSHMSLIEAHNISDLIMQDLENKFEGSEIIIHQDPVGVEHNVMYKEI